MEATQPKKRWVNGYPDTPGFQPTGEKALSPHIIIRLRYSGAHYDLSTSCLVSSV